MLKDKGSRSGSSDESIEQLEQQLKQLRGGKKRVVKGDNKGTASVIGSKANKILGIDIPPIANIFVDVEIIGITDLICRKFSDKAEAEIAAKQQGQAKADKRKPREPEVECHDARYLNAKGQDCVRAVFFKKGMVEMAKYFGIPMAAVSTSLWVEGDLIPIKHSEKKPAMRTDPVRIGRFNAKVTTLAYRPTYKEWSCQIRVGFDTNILTAQQVIALLAHAGVKNGVGEWRPQKNGDFGRFEVRPASGPKKR